MVCVMTHNRPGDQNKCRKFYSVHGVLLVAPEVCMRPLCGVVPRTNQFRAYRAAMQPHIGDLALHMFAEDQRRTIHINAAAAWRLVPPLLELRLVPCLVLLGPILVLPLSLIVELRPHGSELGGHLRHLRMQRAIT